MNLKKKKLIFFAFLNFFIVPKNINFEYFTKNVNALNGKNKNKKKQVIFFNSTKGRVRKYIWGSEIKWPFHIYVISTCVTILYYHNDIYSNVCAYDSNLLSHYFDLFIYI